MTLSNDFVRREARASQDEHRHAMVRMREAIRRTFSRESSAPAAARSELALGGINRRRFLQFSGLTIAGAAVLAACGDDSDSGSSSSTDTDAMTGGATTGGTTDVTILRTAQSLEELAINVYQIAIDSSLVTTAAVASAAMLFQEQHREHAELFSGATEQAGGKSFAEPNPAVLDMIQPTIDSLSDENGVVSLAFDLETVAAQTYQGDVGMFTDPTLNVAIMSVGGVEARHAAVLASVLGQDPVPVAFQVTDMAVPAGTGV